MKVFKSFIFKQEYNCLFLLKPLLNTRIQFCVSLSGGAPARSLGLCPKVIQNLFQSLFRDFLNYSTYFHQSICKTGLLLPRSPKVFLIAFQRLFKIFQSFLKQIFSLSRGAAAGSLGLCLNLFCLPAPHSGSAHQFF